ncbi:CRISPR-associated endonuclease Csn1 [Flavobacterium arsenatis]|uniref:CRISPR-associated endonuclease Cas9 n=1 Tax=Flavobacterium arsenatis TaxID=1484332 RepID=A0ABU1TUE2_9FLAO|nr:type II CRISPR RNA-guided endonuclease Cas9 [Flavobacterium arsenatis]MDR6969492.1 CRISPR-associated endonuclease Csn1 [Flavobacterium arsenatis]
MSKRKLGLDIGTNSLGWTVVEKEDGIYDFLKIEDENGELTPSKGSYIFSKSVDANENSKASERRGFRGARRRIDRIRLRKIGTLKVLNEFGLCPKFEVGELNRWKNKKIYPCENIHFIDWQRTGKKNGNSQTEKLKQPYYLRNLAASKPGMMDTNEGRLQLGRAFYHLSQRRGYLSNSEDEQSDDKIDLFKTDVNKLLENCSGSGDFKVPYEVIFNLYKSDDKVKKLNSKISKVLKTEPLLENIKIFIEAEFEKPENLGKVMSDIGKLSKEMEGFPTMGCYFYSIYNKQDKDTGLINRIRGRYTHREKHYEAEFNHICEIQNITGDLKDKLHNAIFYQRPLKSQKGLVAKCTLEPKRKRIGLSHPLFEEFRMWESVNRIKIKREFEDKLDFLNSEEKELIKNEFLQITDFEFGKIANKLSNGLSYNYIKRPEEVFLKGKELDKDSEIKAVISFNFPMDKKFSACPTTSSLRKAIGIENYNAMQLLNTGYKDEKGKKQSSIEDIWHCLQMDSFGSKDKKTVRAEFAKKHLQLDEKGIENFVKIKLVKGYGSLSKSAIKKIIPYLERGEIYTNAVFLANVSEVLGRKISGVEQNQVSETIKKALENFRFEKQNKGIVNNYISKFKDNRENSLGNNQFSIEAHKRELEYEIANWIGEIQLGSMKKEEVAEITETCWNLFFEVACDKLPKDVNYLSTKTIPKFIEEELREIFPNDKIDVSKLYHPSAIESYPKADKKLGNPEITSIKNPVFDRAMHQVKRLCNELIRKGLVDKDTEVNLEVAGEINSASYRRALSIWQKEQEEIRTWAREKIIECYPEEDRKSKIPSDSEIAKYILYSEQNGRCLYTSETITPRDFLNKQTVYDIEHTIPRSKNNDNSLKNKTLANYDFNRNYKKAVLPGLLSVHFNGKEINKEIILLNRNEHLKSYSFVGKKPNMNIVWNVSLSDLKFEYKKFKNAAKAITDAVAHDEVMTKAHYTKMKLDYLREKYRNFEIEEINNQFTNANLVDTRIITKYARAYLNSYFNKVNVVNGKITDTLRKIWGLQGNEDIKDRSNHIHHCIDAIVVACAEKGTANRISELYHKYENDYFRGNSNPRISAKEPMKNFVERMKNLHKEVLVYHKQTDRIKPLLINAQKENAKKLNLRGRLNSQNPYAHIKKDGELIFAQREKVSNLTVKDIEENIIDEGIKKRILDFAKEVGLESFVKESNKMGYMILPKYYDEEKRKDISEMIIKRLRIKSSKSNLKDYKEIRKSDRNQAIDKDGKLKFGHKFDFYFNKDSYTNYEARIYGDLIPNEKGKFINREYKVINHHNIVKNIFEKEERSSILQLHQDDMFLVFDINPKDEIDWKNIQDLQNRLFKIVKFDENGIIVLVRHNFAGGNVGYASPIKSENDLTDISQVVLRRSPSTLRIIPAKLNALGKLDLSYSKDFLTSRSHQ